MELNMDSRLAEIKVKMDQLSLAIGKQGQNVRLASKLTDVSININAYEPEVVDPFAEHEARHAARMEAEAAAQGDAPAVSQAATPQEAAAPTEAAAPQEAAAPTEAAAPETPGMPEVPSEGEAAAGGQG